MADIRNAINKFKTAVNGEDVRDGFVETMTRVNKENEQLKADNVALGLRVSDLEISGMEIGLQNSELEIRITELEGAKSNV